MSLFLFFRTLTGSISELEEKKGITHGFLEPKDITITGALYDEDKVAMLLNPPKTNDLSLRDYKHLYISLVETYVGSQDSEFRHFHQSAMSAASQEPEKSL